MTTKITSAIWDDPDFMELSDAEKLTIFWVLTKANLLGWVEATPRKLARDMEAPWEHLEAACKKLSRSFVLTPRGVWVKNYIRKQFGQGQALARSHMSKSLRKQITDAPEEIRNLILEEYPEISSPSLPAPKVLGSSMEATREREREIEGEIEGEGETQDTPTEHPILTRIRGLFRMKPHTAFDPSTLRAFAKNKKTAAGLTEHDWTLLQWAYRQTDGPAATYRRRDPATLLNNLLAELLRAREWSRTQQADLPSRFTEPSGWQDIITTADPSFNCTTWAALPESLQAYVREEIKKTAATTTA